MLNLITAAPLLAMQAPAAAAPSILVQIFPFAVMLLIFYVILVLPARRKQKKVAEFQASLKVGDKVITSGGIYGTVSRLGEGTVQIQIADKVKIEISRAAISGYQGQTPVMPESEGAA
jgi:preprotein translocase subunit YajC